MDAGGWLDPSLTPDQVALAELLSDISESTYAAGWFAGIEWQVWALVTGQPSTLDQQDISTSDTVRLLRLFFACGGWVTWDSARGCVVFVPSERWLLLAGPGAS